MNPDVIFERLATGTYDLGFTLKVNAQKWQPNTTLADATTYAALDLGGLDKPGVNESWGDYILAAPPEMAESQDGDDPAAWLILTFLRSSTGPARVGGSYSSTAPLPPDKFILNATLAETHNQVVPYGTAPPSTTGILESSVKPLNGIHSLMNKKAVLSYDGTPLYSWVMDEETGKGYPVMEQVVPAGTEGSEIIAADGEFDTVMPYNAHWSILTRRKTTTLSSVPEVKTVTRRTPVNWPARLNYHAFLAVYDQVDVYWKKEMNHMLLAAYTGDVLIEVSTWWQKTAPAPITPVEMMPTGIVIPRKWSDSISIRPCLHPEIVVSEPLVVGPFPFTGMPNVGIRNVTYRVPATNVVDWPDYVLQLEPERYQGGYRCVQEKIFKPATVVDGTEVSISAYEDETYIFHNYA